MLIASVLSCFADPVRVNPTWQVSYTANAKGRAGISTAVPVNGDSVMVSVLNSGANPSRPTVRIGSRQVPSQVIGHDRVSRLGFVRIKGPPQPQSTQWASTSSGIMGAPLSAKTSAGVIKCRATGWVKQVGGKVLPLALINVTFEKQVPAPGTPIFNTSNKVVALVFQSSGSGNAGYAIPAEAVHRVRHDITNSGKLVRGYLGIALRAENQTPQVVRVLPNSPAARAGIRTSDVLLSLGDRKISDYADAANAFFYLIPGEKVKLKLLRGAEPLEFVLTPSRPQAH